MLVRGEALSLFQRFLELCVAMSSLALVALLTIFAVEWIRKELMKGAPSINPCPLADVIAGLVENKSKVVVISVGGKVAARI